MVSCVVEYKIGVIYSIDVLVLRKDGCVVVILVVEVIVEIVIIM